MSLHPKPLPAIPTDTFELARKLLPLDNTYLQIGDKLSQFVADQDFVDLYHREGKPALSPALLSVVLLFQAMEGLSDRKAASAVVTRIDWKYALHLPLDYSGFNYSVLSEFRDRLLEKGASGRVFDQLLNQLQALGLLKGSTLQRSDSLAVLTKLRQLNRLELLVETLRLALEAVARVVPHWLSSLLPQSGYERYTQAAYQHRLVPFEGEQAQKETKKLVEQTGQDGVWFLQQLNQEDTPPQLVQLEQIKTLAQVWEQHFEVVQGQAQLRQKLLVAGAQRLETPHDPEVRYSEKRGQAWIGYKVHVTETALEGQPQLITDIRTTLATGADSEQVEPIQKALIQRKLQPKQHLVDAGYVKGRTIAHSEQRNIALVGPIREDNSAQARCPDGITLERFELDYTSKVAICPAGQHSQGWNEGTARGEVTYRIWFDRKICGECSLYRQCVTGKGRRENEGQPVGRTLKVGLYHPQVRTRRQAQHTEGFKQLYRRRAGIEASLSEMVRSHGLRVARYVGLAKVGLEHLMKGAATNLKRAARWLAGERPCAQRKAKRGLQGLQSKS